MVCQFTPLSVDVCARSIFSKAHTKKHSFSIVYTQFEATASGLDPGEVHYPSQQMVVISQTVQKINLPQLNHHKGL